jgi:hypothetical protein
MEINFRKSNEKAGQFIETRRHKQSQPKTAQAPNPGPKQLRHQRPKIRKVKETTPSPFYDGKYHPPIFSSTRLHSQTN